MFVYPSGLTCKASQMRVRLYEGIVPYLAVALIVGALPLGMHLLFDGHAVIRSLAIVAALWSIWIPTVALMAFGVFVWWCKPVGRD